MLVPAALSEIESDQHIEGGADDLRPDAVARQDEETGRSSRWLP
jgi:hypothetical protein